MSWLWNLLFPPKCILCRGLLENGEQDLCEECRIFGPDYPNRKKSTQFLDSFAAVWYYEGNVRKSILRYKFSHARHYAPGYGRFLSRKIAEVYPEGFDILSWVPVSPRRKLTRGYDQAELLADAAGAELDGNSPKFPTVRVARVKTVFPLLFLTLCLLGFSLIHQLVNKLYVK